MPKKEKKEITSKEWFEQKHFANHLWIVLDHWRISYSKFAKMVGVSRQTVHYWCTGEKTPSMKLFRDICIALKIKPEFLLGLDIDMGGGQGDCLPEE